MSDKVLKKKTIRAGDEIWFFSSKDSVHRRAKAEDFKHNRNVILIHGFTANGHYMNSLAEALENHGCNTFMFNYHSYRGIKQAADSLGGLLNDINKLEDKVITKNKVALVAHSMGGLVSRALFQLTPYSDFVSSMVTLGTPHCGTLYNSKLLEFIIGWGQKISTTMPGFTTSCKSAKELTKTDSENGVPLLDKMAKSSQLLDSIPTLSISAGKPWLEVGYFFSNFIANSALQKEFKGFKNDGLVTESSSNLKYSMNLTGNNSSHLSDYDEYSELNHTYIIQNYRLSLRIANWLKNNDALN